MATPKNFHLNDGKPHAGKGLGKKLRAKIQPPTAEKPKEPSTRREFLTSFFHQQPTPAPAKPVKALGAKGKLRRQFKKTQPANAAKKRSRRAAAVDLEVMAPAATSRRKFLGILGAAAAASTIIPRLAANWRDSVQTSSGSGAVSGSWNISGTVWGSWATSNDDLAGYDSYIAYGWVSDVLQGQNRSNWCWAAVGLSVGLWYKGISEHTNPIPAGIYTSQCSLIRDVADPNNFFKCCTYAGSLTSCNFPGSVHLAMLQCGVSVVIIDNPARAQPSFADVMGYTNSTSLSFPDLRPFVCQIRYVNFQDKVINHVVAIWSTFDNTQYTTDWVRIEDPAYGTTWMSWDNFPVSYKGTDTATYMKGWTTGI